MIYYLCKKNYSDTVKSFLATWGRDLKSHLRVIPYETFFRKKYLPAGTYFFSDLERLSALEAETAAIVWRELRSQWAEEIRLLNHPTISLSRFELLRQLFNEGINDYNVYRMAGDSLPHRFPVFLRNVNEHEGPYSELLSTPQELHDAIQRLDENGKSRENKMIVEYCDTSDKNGLFRKYSCFNVSGLIIPRHIYFGRNWMLKYPDLFESEIIQEEIDFMQMNPHEAQLKKIFALAHIDYGRIDYSIKHGQIQVWEINTNPHIAGFISAQNPARLPIHEAFLKIIIPALRLTSNTDLRGKVKNPLRRLERIKHFSQITKSVAEEIIYSLPISIQTKASIHYRMRALKSRIIPR